MKDKKTTFNDLLQAAMRSLNQEVEEWRYFPSYNAFCAGVDEDFQRFMRRVLDPVL